MRFPATIFVTAFDKYAVRAFDEHAVDYFLPKPFEQDRFSESLARAKEIRVDGKVAFLRNSEVAWIEAAANYLRIRAGQRLFFGAG